MQKLKILSLSSLKLELLNLCIGSGRELLRVTSHGYVVRSTAGRHKVDRARSSTRMLYQLVSLSSKAKRSKWNFSHLSTTNWIWMLSFAKEMIMA
jgi:hypothetical protein